MSDVIDLDALLPAAATVKIGDKEVTIAPPSLQDVMLLGSLSQKMTKNDDNDPDLEKLSDTISQLTEQVYKCAPALKGQPLNTAQLMKLVEIIIEISMPTDAKKLEERGITPADPKAPPSN